MNSINIPQALGISLLGMGIVFLMLAVLWGVVALIGATMKRKTPVPAAAGAALAASAAEKAAKAPAFPRDSVDTHDVPDEVAAMLMAIVADASDIPAEELAFKSIKEIKA